MTDSYTYIPIFGKYVVVAPGVCGGRPTLIGTRLTTEQIASFATRDGVNAVATEYKLKTNAVKEAIVFQEKQIAIDDDESLAELSAYREGQQ
jgi:uncharacterized protein (DUF433 family)